MTVIDQEATVPHPQETTNTDAARWLADVLDGWGLSDPGDRAEWVVDQLIERGVRPVPVLPPLRGPGATDTHRRRSKALIDAAFARCTCDPSTGPDIECRRHGECAAQQHPTEDVPGRGLVCHCGAIGGTDS